MKDMKNMAKTKFAVPFALVFALSVALAGSTWAQAVAPARVDPSTAVSQGASLPSADAVLKHYDDAIGGRAAWEKLHTRVSKGTIEIPAMNNLSGTIEVFMKAPNSALVVINLGGAIIRQGFDGTTAWADDPRNGLRILTGDELEDQKRESNFYHALDLAKLYSKMTVTGTDKIRDHDAYVIEATSAAGGDPDKLYFDIHTGLQLRTINHRHTPEGPLAFTADISDYKEVDGVKVPFTVGQSSAQSALIIKFTDIQHNVDLDDSQFAKPASEPPADPAPKPADEQKPN